MDFEISKNHPIPGSYSKSRKHAGSTKFHVLEAMKKMVVGDSILVEQNNNAWNTKSWRSRYYGTRSTPDEYGAMKLSTVKQWINEWHVEHGYTVEYIPKDTYYKRTKIKIDQTRLHFICDGYDGHVRIWKIN